MLYISLIFIFFGVFLALYSYLMMPYNNNYPKQRKEKQKYCILIPARNESKVIEGLLESIENQSRKINSEDVYIIVEDKEDKTVQIANKHKMRIVYKKEELKGRKGYALDDAIKEILKGKKHYTAYFILDADNVLDKDFIKEMSKNIEAGYDIGVGYRNTKNGDNLVDCASVLAFTFLNTLSNKRKSKYSNNVIISGTGFYIRGEEIEKLGGYPFYTLTEDYELSMYASINNLTTVYNENAMFYDEQPDSFKQSIIQRTRWIKGYFEVRKKYLKKLKFSISKKDRNYSSKISDIIGINPLLLMFAGVFLYLINSLITEPIIYFVYKLLLVLIIVYVILLFVTYNILKKERFKLNIKMPKIKILLYNPIFLLSFIICLFKAIFNKNVEWIPLEIKTCKSLFCYKYTNLK